jgi:hypothetical protein
MEQDAFSLGFLPMHDVKQRKLIKTGLMNTKSVRGDMRRLEQVGALGIACKCCCPSSKHASVRSLDLGQLHRQCVPCAIRVAHCGPAIALMPSPTAQARFACLSCGFHVDYSQSSVVRDKPCINIYMPSNSSMQYTIVKSFLLV